MTRKLKLYTTRDAVRAQYPGLVNLREKLDKAQHATHTIPVTGKHSRVESRVSECTEWSRMGK